MKPSRNTIGQTRIVHDATTLLGRKLSAKRKTGRTWRPVGLFADKCALQLNKAYRRATTAT